MPLDFLKAHALWIVTLVVDISGTYVKQFAVIATRVLVYIFVHIQSNRVDIIISPIELEIDSG